MLYLISEKIKYDQNSLIKNQLQFSHTIDEIIQFDTQIKNFLKDFTKVGYTNSQFSCLHILCENCDLFGEWTNLERQISQKKIDSMFAGLNNDSFKSDDKSNMSSGTSLLSNDTSKNEIWSCNYSDVDTMKPPHCAESFILILKSISDRYSNLPYPSKKLEFTELQLELLNDFHLRLCQIIRDESKTPFNKNYLGVLNTVNYIIYVLEEWKNSPVKS